MTSFALAAAAIHSATHPSGALAALGANVLPVPVSAKLPLRPGHFAGSGSRGQTQRGCDERVQRGTGHRLDRDRHMDVEELDRLTNTETKLLGPEQHPVP